MVQRGLPVGLSVMIGSPAKTDEPIEMLFGLWTWVGQRIHVFDGGPDPPWKGRGNFEGEGIPSMCGSDVAFCQITLTTCLSMHWSKLFEQYVR